MESPSNTGLQYNEVASSYEKGQKSFTNGNLNATRNFILNQLPYDLPIPSRSHNIPKILDIGCGFGADLKFYRDLGFDCYGIDVSKAMVEKARDTNPEISHRIKIGDSKRLEFPNDYFDAVTSRFSLHYNDPAGINLSYLHIHDVLKDGGKFIAIVPHPVNSFVRQKRKVYGNHETIKVPLYGGKVVVTQQTHSFTDFLSPTFNALFALESLIEGNEHDDNHIRGFKVPGYLAFVGRKK